jgi:hypothetical protein
MPPRKPRRPAKAPEAQPVAAAIAPSGLKTWQTFAFLIVIAIVWHYFRPLLIVVGIFVGLFWGVSWLCRRFPRTMYWIALMVEGLSGRRRR